MIWVLFFLQAVTAAGLLTVYWRSRRRDEVSPISEEEAEAEAFLANTVERLLGDLRESAERATTGLNEQMRALETLLAKADDRLARLPLTDLTGDLARLNVSEPAEGPATIGATWTAEVIDLASGGLAPLQIAKQIGRGETEVRLVLGGRLGERA